MTVKRTTQVVVESVSNVTATARVSQLVVEAVSSNALKMMVTQLVAEMVSENVPDDAVGGQTAHMMMAMN